MASCKSTCCDDLKTALGLPDPNSSTTTLYNALTIISTNIATRVATTIVEENVVTLEDSPTILVEGDGSEDDPYQLSIAPGAILPGDGIDVEQDADGVVTLSVEPLVLDPTPTIVPSGDGTDLSPYLFNLALGALQAGPGAIVTQNPNGTYTIAVAGGGGVIVVTSADLSLLVTALPGGYDLSIDLNGVDGITTTRTGTGVWEISGVTLNNAILALQADVALLEADMLAAQATLVTLQGQMVTAQADIDALELAMTAAQATLVTLQGQMATAQGNIASLQTDVGVLQADMIGAQADIATLQGQMATAQLDITALEGDMLTAQANITTLQGQMVTAQADIATLQGQMVTAQANITALQAAVGTLQGQMVTAQADIAALQVDVGALQGQMVTAQADITALQADVTALQTDVATLQGQVATLQTDVTNLTNAVTALQTDVATLQTQVTNILAGGVQLAYVTAGANVSVLGDGTLATPYIVSSTGGGVAGVSASLPMTLDGDLILPGSGALTANLYKLGRKVTLTIPTTMGVAPLVAVLNSFNLITTAPLPAPLSDWVPDVAVYGGAPGSVVTLRFRLQGLSTGATITPVESDYWIADFDTATGSIDGPLVRPNGLSWLVSLLTNYGVASFLCEWITAT